MNVLTSEEIGQLLGRLLRGTIDKHLAWRQSEDDDDYFFAAFSQRFIFSVASVDKDDAHPYRLVIWRRGTEPPSIIQAVTSADLDSTVDSDTLEELYGAVKRQVLKLDSVLSDILDDLGKLEEPF